MRLLCKVLGLTAAVSGLCAAPANADTFTLAQVLAMTYQSNPQLQQARVALQGLDQGVAQANAGWRPNVGVSASYGSERGVVTGFPNPFNSNPLMGQVTVSEPLYRGGRTVAEVGRAVAEVHAGRAQLASTEQQVLLQAVTAYMDVVRDSESLRINRDNVSTLETEFADVKTELAAGEVTKTDTSQAEARLARARADEAIAEAQLATSRATFENIIGTPAETLERSPTLPPLPKTKEQALDLALKSHPDLLEARASERAANYAVDDAAGALLPQVTLSGQYQYLRDAAGTNIYTTRNPQSVVSVLGQVSVPIYQGGQEEATVRRAKDAHSQAELGIVVAERNVRQDLDSAWQALRSADAAIAANEAQEAADQTAIAGVKQEQEAGERSVLDVLNAQEELFSAEVALVSARHDRVIAAYKLLAAAGELNARALALNVKLYDPRDHYNDAANAWFGLGN